MSNLPLVIEVEGVDGSGKTTALEYLYNELTSLGLRVIKVRENGNALDPKNAGLREVILNPDTPMDSKAMELVFSAMRVMNYELYKTFAGKYDIVLSDRGWLSHLAYCDNNVDETFTSDLYEFFLEPYVHLPDAVVFVRTSPETALARRKARNEKNGVKPDAIEAKGNEFQVKVAESFEKYLEAYSNAFLQISMDGNADIEGVKAEAKKTAETIRDTYFSADNTKAANDA